jgi:hypothetical protein
MESKQPEHRESHAAVPESKPSFAAARKAARGPDPQTKLHVQIRVNCTVPDAKAVAVQHAAEAFLKACAAEEVEVRGGADLQAVFVEPPPRAEEKAAPVYFTRPDNPEPVPSQRMPNPPPSPEPHPLVGVSREKKS